MEARHWQNVDRHSTHEAYSLTGASDKKKQTIRVITNCDMHNGAKEVVKCKIIVNVAREGPSHKGPVETDSKAWE